METTSPSAEGPVWRFQEHVFIPSTRVLQVRGEPIPLEPRLAALLRLLLERAGETVSREELLGRVWGVRGADDSLTQAICRLRRLLGDAEIIETTPRVGYRITEAVQVLDEVPPVTAVAAVKTHSPSAGAGAESRQRPYWAGFWGGLVVGSVVTALIILASIRREVVTVEEMLGEEGVPRTVVTQRDCGLLGRCDEPAPIGDGSPP